MHLNPIVCRRLGISLSILWLVAVGGLATYEWLSAPPVSDHFVEVLIQKTGEPISSLKGNAFADLVPVEHRLKWKPFSLALLVPVAALWLVGSLLWWVLSGFTRDRT